MPNSLYHLIHKTPRLRSYSFTQTYLNTSLEEQSINLENFKTSLQRNIPAAKLKHATMSGSFSSSFKQAYRALLKLSPAPKPTILLVHGGWTGPEQFSKIIVLLESKGYPTCAPTLPSVGTVPALQNFDEDVETIRNAARSLIDSGKEVAIIMHSYGAIPGCEAMRDLKTKKMHSGEPGGGVVKMIFLAGLVVPVGGSTWKSEKGEAPIPGFVYQV